VAALAFVTGAQAHSVGWPIHKVVCKASGKLCDKAPPGPNLDCNASRVGEIAVVYDEVLGAYVEWECRQRGDGSYGWFRLRIVPDSWKPFWIEQPQRTVYDWHRACESIVCKKVRVVHTYPRLFAQGGFAAWGS
jgi:hypothetical protein